MIFYLFYNNPEMLEASLILLHENNFYKLNTYVHTFL